MTRSEKIASIVLLISVCTLSVIPGCAPHSGLDSGNIKYRLSDGYLATCKYAEMHGCGLKLYQCTDGKVYMCQTNLAEIGQ